jgi:hypothetical protein
MHICLFPSIQFVSRFCCGGRDFFFLFSLFDLRVYEGVLYDVLFFV